MKKLFNRRGAFVLFLILSVVWMAVIFGFSSSDAEESTVQSNSVTELLIKIFEEDYETLSDAEKLQLVEKYDGIVRKIAHFGIFGVLGFLTYFAAGSLVWIPDFRLKPVRISLPCCVVFAITDELHQMFVPGRSCQIRDVLIDSSGALSGTLAAMVVVLIAKSMLKKKSENVSSSCEK